ncbi:MAG: BLUF domain-containing protein [Sphingomonas sp.]|uniref:BLUF domain-containing protein n=1 Tax=Sphingomonas sp. TaxID=28214 RepID=UPI0017F70819|nr:BLUF domain-containing protein [Sphingomonas sp.]MBA3667791.1 BLUF domain-containing protein [Sphingomonas sp.]
MELKSLTYTSWAAPGMTSEQLSAILSSARTNNPLDGISGLLIFNGVAFMQVLEGAGSAIDDLAGRLVADTRHSNMSIRDERPIDRRSFPDWAMAYLELEAGEFIGDAEVERALRRDLPDSLRNVMLGLVHNLSPH